MILFRFKHIIRVFIHATLKILRVVLKPNPCFFGFFVSIIFLFALFPRLKKPLQVSSKLSKNRKTDHYNLRSFLYHNKRQKPEGEQHIQIAFLSAEFNLRCSSQRVTIFFSIAKDKKGFHSENSFLQSCSRVISRVGRFMDRSKVLFLQMLLCALKISISSMRPQGIRP